MRTRTGRWTGLLAAMALLLAAIATPKRDPAHAAQDPESRAVLTRGFARGALDHRAIGALAISPSGVLFFADDQAGAIYGVDLDESRGHASRFARVPDLGSVVAARLGTTVAGIQIRDAVVSPLSGITYLSVRKLDGADQNPANPANYALFAVSPDGSVTPVDLRDRRFGRVAIQGRPAYRAGQNETRIISDIAYARGRLLVAALSTEGFQSNLYSVAVPFRQDGVAAHATSIYHVSHRRQETASPIQTLTIYRDADRDYLIAAYVCTPVVRFDLDDLAPGQVVTGTTVAELGSGNRPADMIAYGKPGAQSLLLNNSVFGVMKVDARIAREREAVNEKTAADRGPRGSRPYPGLEVVEPLRGAKAYAAWGDESLLVVKPTAGGDLALEPMPLP